MIQSPVFWLLAFFAPIVYWRVPRGARDGLLGIVSCAYLATIEPVGMSIVLAWTLLFFGAARIRYATDRTFPLRMLVLAVIGSLIFQKYFPVFMAGLIDSGSPAEAVLIPLGISYFTFKFVHYAIEVGRGNIIDCSLQRFFCYIFLFPIFTAGPIERFDHFLANRDTSWKLQTTVEGLTRIAHGLIKIFVIAQLLDPAFYRDYWSVEYLLENLETIHVYKVWAFLALTYLRAYMDFSAYSDIAIGTSRLFGFRIMENFNFPILAWNIQDFWKRWHMTLAGWCQAYVYLPLIGLSRSPYVAVYGTFIVMGLWHGASWNWLCWGVYHATGVSLYVTWRRWKQKIGLVPVAKSPLRLLSAPLTFAFVAGSYAFSGTTQAGVWSALAVFAKLFCLNIPA